VGNRVSLKLRKETLLSEIRGVFLHTPWGQNPDWNLIADTCVSYGINTVVIETYNWHFWQNGVVKDFPALRTAIEAFHKRGLPVHVLLCVGLHPESNMRALTSSGEIDYTCFTKQASRKRMLDIAETLARDYDIDGFMFDYIRWEYTTDVCLCSECKAKFIADTGLSDVNWPSDVLEDGRYYWQFLQWRVNPITEAVRDMREKMLSIKPNIAISAAVWAAFLDCGNYWVTYLGQHTADWVDKGYLDFVSPMVYTDKLTGGESVEDYTRSSRDYYVGATEGKIPLPIFITTGIEAPRSIDTFVQTVRIIKQNGADGWFIWRYGGPGLTAYIDVRPYLQALIDAGLMPAVWSMENIQASKPSENELTVSWTTTTPTSGRIEYSEQPIFTAATRYGDFGRLIYYKDINYVGGTRKEDPTLKNSHVFTIPVTDKTEFRIQSIDSTGVAVTTRPISVKELAPAPPPPPPPPRVLAAWRFPICSRFPNIPPCPAILNIARKLGLIGE
jgi:hypothetical protein